MSLIVTGTIGIDTVETPDGERREAILGGSAAYFSAAAQFYLPVRLVAAVGDDFPDGLMAQLRHFPAVDASGLEIRRGSKSFRWGGRYQRDMDQRDTLFTDLGVLAEAPPEIPENFRDSRYVFLANMHPALQADLLSKMTGPRLVVADTMNLWIDIAKDDLTSLLGRVDGLVLNFDEAEQFTGKRNPVTAGRLLLEYGPRFVVVKKGEHGAILVHRDGLAALPAYPAEQVVDPTGAGDTFAGGLMGYLAAADPTDPGDFATLRRAMAHGTVMASFTIETFSLDRLRTLDREQLEARYREYAAMIHLG